MPYSHRAATFVLLFAAVFAGCGGEADRSSGDRPSNPQQTPAQPAPGTGATGALPSHTVEAPTEVGATREYFEGALESEGVAERGDIPRETRGLLVTTQVGTASSRSYEFSEDQIAFDVPYKLLGTTTSRGTLTVGDELPGLMPKRLYRLDESRSPARARSFIRVYDTLYTPEDPADPGLPVEFTSSMDHVATAAKGRVVIASGLSSARYITWQVLLSVGDELIVRLPLWRPDRVWLLKQGSEGQQLAGSGGSRREGDVQLFTFKVVATGQTELTLQSVDAKDRSSEYGLPYKARIEVR